MQGKDKLSRCSQEVKDIIEANFGTLDAFYAYFYQIGVNQYVGFKKIQKLNGEEETLLKEFMQKKGIDYFGADDLVGEIIGDFDESLITNRAEILLGPDWKVKLNAFQQLINE